MGLEQYHEPADELSTETHTFARMIVSLTEEAEAIKLRAVDVKHSDEMRIVRQQRHDDFRSRRAIARDVIREFCHVRDAKRPAFLRRGAANTAAQRDANTGRPALKRTEHQLAGFQEVKTHPVQARDRIENQRCAIGHVSDGVGFVFDQCPQPCGEFIVKLLLA